MVFPLAGQENADGDSRVGSGFLVEVDGETYLTTAAHLATGNPVITDKWESWDDELVLYSAAVERIGRYPLFDKSEDAARDPRFKFLRAQTRLVDMILLPLEPGDPLLEAFDAFQLPSETAPTSLNQSVTMVGCKPWPTVNKQPHTLALVGAIHHVSPQQEEGYSGCPVIDSDGCLVGMPFGGDLPGAPGRGLLVSAGIIHAATRAIDGH